MKRTSAAICLILFLLLLTVLSAQARDDAVLPDLDIAPGPLSVTLEAFYRQTGVQMIYVDAVVAGRQSPGARGGYAFHDAITRLLDGTGLSFEVVNRNTVVIKAAERPAAATGHFNTFPPVTAEMDTLIVSGAALERVALSRSPAALPAPVQVLDRQRVESMPYTRATDLLRGTPGVTFGSSSPGGDIGDDISIRGFSSFHGADVAVYVDGMPVNWPHSPMRHGMTDFNWLTPEVIERIEVIKGPFSAEYGDFNLSGVINIVTKTADAAGVGIEAGQYGRHRVSGIFSGESSAATPFLAYEYLDHRDYRDHNDSRRVSAFNKLTLPAGRGRLSLRLSAAKRENDSAGFLSADEIRAGTIGRRDVNPASRTDRGENDNLALVANYSDDAGLAVTAYAGHDRVLQLDTIFNPFQTYAEGRRNYAGWRASQALGREGRTLLVVGTDGQFAAGRVRAGAADGAGGLDETARSRDEETLALTAAVFFQGQWRLPGALKLVGGARYDHVHADVTNRLFPHSGDATQTALSPKIGLVWAPLDGVEIFTNTGRGFRTPASTELSPNQPEAAFNRKLGVAGLRSADIGLSARSNGAELTFAYYATTTENELRLDAGNPGNYTNVGGTRRSGYEITGEWLATETLRFGFSHAGVDARIRDPATPGADRVITVPENVQILNVSWRPALGSLPLAIDLHVQRLGPRPLSADGAVRAEPQVTWGAKARLSRGAWVAFIETVYAPDRYSSDFVFDLDGLVFNPRPLVSVLTGIRYRFG